MSPAKEVALLEGAAGSAVGNDTPPAAPAALLPPETPETPQKIDYADFVAQTTQEPPDCHYHATESVKAKWKKQKNCKTPLITHDLFMIHESHEINKQIKAKISKNSKSVETSVSTDPAPDRDRRIFFADAPSVEGYLDRMLAEMDGTHMSGKHPHELDMPIERQAVFAQALNEAHMQLVESHQESVYESVLHLPAYAVAMEFDGYQGAVDEKSGKYLSGIQWMKRKLAKWIKSVRKSKSKYDALYIRILDDLKPLYIKEGCGWVCLEYRDMPNSSKTAEWERNRGGEFRWHLHPVWRQWCGMDKKPPAEPVAENKPPIVSLEPILSAIAERLGQNRFDLWFGQDTNCDVVGDTVVFTVRNIFSVNGIRRHCSEDVDAVLKQFGYKKAEYNVQPQEPTMKSDESVSIAMASARACNLEHYLANIDAFITPMVNDNGVMSFTEREPPGLKGDDLKAFRKAKSKRIKEMYDAHEVHRRRANSAVANP